METIPEELPVDDQVSPIPEDVQQNDPVAENDYGRGFKIKIVSLEDMDHCFELSGCGVESKKTVREDKEPLKKITVKVEIKEKSLGESEEILVEDKEVSLNWEIFFEIPEGTDLLDELVNHPLVITVSSKSFSPSVEESAEPIKGKGGKGKRSKSPSEKEKSIKDPSISNESKKTKKSAQSKKILPNIEVFSVLGVCNVDVLPLLLGERAEVEDVLLLNPTTENKGSDIIAWENLPKLRVSVLITGNIVDDTSKSISNILFFTLESLHNINPDCTKDLEAATILPNNQVIKFDRGNLVLDDSVWVCKRKKWHGLKDLPGQGALSSYKVADNNFNLFSTMAYELSNNSMYTKPRIHWNQFHRSFLNDDLEKAFKEKIVKYSYWPVKLHIQNLSVLKSEEQSEGKNKTEKLSDVNSNYYITFLDLSKLIYPGENSIRLASQLYTYTEESMKSNFGSSYMLFDNDTTISNDQDVKTKTASSKKDAIPGSVKSKKGSTKSKKGSTKSKNEKKKIDEIEELNEEEPIPQKESEPVFNEEGDPIFIVVEVELLKPLIEKRSEEQVLESIHKIIPVRGSLTTEQLETINNTRMYEDCIKDLIHNIHDEYQIFFNASETVSNSSKKFLMHLQMKGAYTKMVERMKESIAHHVRDTLGHPNTWGRIKNECQDSLTCFYHEMANKMYTIVNSIPYSSGMKYEPDVTFYHLKYYESEAIEEDDYNKAHYYLLQRLEKSEKANPQVWIDLAKFWKNIFEFEKAEECSKEAISLKPRHTNALMFHGLLSWLMEDFTVAEMFLLAVVSFNPSSLEGWVLLYMFHKQIGKQKEACVELSHAKDCVNEFLPDNDVISSLYWRADLSETDRIFLLTAAKLFNLSFPEFAELALSYDLLLHGRTVNYLYHLAVCHYQQGRYTNSLTHIEEALKMQWEDERLWALKGHNFYKLQKLEEAKKAYHVALNFKDKLDHHLINLRLGNIFMLEGDHQSARDCYLIICRDSPTPLSWLELGISAFVDDDMETAELALTEANTLDKKIGRVWGYLALVNLVLDKPHIFNRCILQAFKYGFEDQVLMERIDSLVKLVQP